MTPRPSGFAVAWVGASALVVGMLASVVELERAIVPVIVILGGLLAGGFVAGIYCWRRSHRIVGLLGLLAPALLPISHFLSILVVVRSDEDEDVWAPTFVGDMLGLAAAVILCIVAIFGALVLARAAHRAGA